MSNALTPATLRETRQKVGITMASLAEQSGVHQTTISRIERGKVDPRFSETWAPIVRVIEACKPAKAKRARSSEAAA